MIDQINDRLPFFNALSKEDQDQFKSHSRLFKGPKGKVIVEAGAVCGMVYFVLSGQLRVYKLSEEGREITLYRAVKGEACLFSLSCVMEEEGLNSITVMEEESELLGISANFFESLMSRNIQFQRYFLKRLLRKISKFVVLTEEIAFHSIESRLARFLLNKSKELDNKTLYLTHEQIAFEIGTAREVVSRMLKSFKKQGVLSLSRGKITINSFDQLENYLAM